MEKNKKTKILFCITKSNSGGAQKYVYNLAVNLSKSEFEAVVACGTKEGTALIEKLATENIRTIPLESSEREINFKKDLQTIKELIRLIREEKPALVHLNSSKIGFLGSLAILYFKFFNFQSFNFKSIFTGHGWAFNERSRHWSSRIIFYLAHYLTVLVCDLTIAVSQKTKGDIAWMPFIKDKIIVIHNGISDFKTLAKKEAGETFGKTGGEAIIFTIAELHKNKGLDVALKGISLLPSEKKVGILYCIAGDGEEKDNLKNLAASLGLTEKVRFMGFVEDAKKLLSGADIFLFPSRTENLPFALLEAGIKGLPVIATSVGGIPEIIQDMKNGILVHPQNPKEIAEAVTYALENKPKTKEFGVELKKTVTNFFSLDKMISETISVYDLK